MKRTQRKLALATETLRRLSAVLRDEDLLRVAGGKPRSETQTTKTENDPPCEGC